MTADSDTNAAGSRGETVFTLIGIGLLGLSAVVFGVVLVYTIGLDTLKSVASPFVLGTVVFTVVVAVVLKKSSDIVDREIGSRGGSGN
jgi:hypothetical protein